MGRLDIIASRVANRVTAEGDTTLEQLRGNWGLSPRFPSGRNFILTKNGVYVRGPYGSEDFRGPIAHHHLFLELGLSNAPDEVRDAFDYFGGNYMDLLEKLEKTGKYFVKRIS
jgi:hypothetical protein